MDEEGAITELVALPDGMLDLGDGWFLGYARGDFDNGSLSAASVIEVVDTIHHVRAAQAWSTGGPAAEHAMVLGLLRQVDR